MADKLLGNRKRISISDVNIDSLTMNETINLVNDYIDKEEPLHLMGVNADKINLANEKIEIKKIINECGLINADGASVILASKFLNTPLPERVAGIDLMMNLLELSNEKKYGVYFLGAEEETIIKMIDNLNKKYPKLNIVGYRNGYFDDNEYNKICTDIKISNPKIVFVGITSPKKELLIKKFQEDKLKPVFMGVGGSFDVLSGKISRAPKWMQENNLEWLFRVYKEPRRLFKRYFIGNMKFIKKVIQEKNGK